MSQPTLHAAHLRAVTASQRRRRADIQTLTPLAHTPSHDIGRAWEAIAWCRRRRGHQPRVHALLRRHRRRDTSRHIRPHTRSRRRRRQAQHLRIVGGGVVAGAATVTALLSYVPLRLEWTRPVAQSRIGPASRSSNAAPARHGSTSGDRGCSGTRQSIHRTHALSLRPNM